jgi:hypothetical protein
VRSLASFAITLTAAFVALLALRLVRAELVEEVYVLVLGAATLLVLVLATRGEKAQPSAFERALRPHPPAVPNRPLELDRLEREVTLGVGGSFHFRQKLLPQLRETAEQRLADRRGQTLSETTVSAPTWELLRPDGASAYRSRYGRGLPIEELEALTDELERI